MLSRPGRVLRLRLNIRRLHTSRPVLERFDPKNVERAKTMLKQLEKEKGREIRVVVLEKGPEIGSHIVSGAVIEPRALNELLPDWKDMPDHPLTVPATSSHMKFLTSKHAIPMPHPPQMSNKGNYVVSLSQFVRWLGSVAEESGVEVYPGFAGAQLLYDVNGAVRGVATHDAGLDKRLHPKSSFEPGMAFRARVTILAEGAHGSLTKQAVKRFNLREGKEPQTYGIGVKEVWRVDPKNHRPGEIIHTMGFRWIGKRIAEVLCITWTADSPYRELQKLKHHPYFASLLEGGERIAYAGRALNEGGFQSIPKTDFAGGALIGCSAGFVNVPKIKGSHTAMKSGILAAEAAYDEVVKGDEEGEGAEIQAATPSISPFTTKAGDMSGYTKALKNSWVWSELKTYEIFGLFHVPLGIWGGIAWSGLDTFILRGKAPWTWGFGGTDAKHTRKASEFKPIEYPAPQPPLSTDLLTAVSLTATNHAENQPVHLQLPYMGVDNFDSEATNVTEYAGLLGRACPAGVYEYVDGGIEPGTPVPEGKEEEAGYAGKKLVINSQNCIHCKLCDIKVPTQDITWTVPEGAGGPKYIGSPNG
ncbi:Electron transfer flavoprotein-ubiquinone oxidoreductase, 4Fe-4S [Rhizoctonia solani]|uniref:Electron transfer flavoprotein-ubiquinone oxidoreductase n=1 Tax=Rhizoctonia solani TaxID=456999 RepID=A0A8H8T2C9_9AGAM|nr:Electron transfer flavoprotein-ubiquinone oxidoreductase, 4Fe-4S [Rhizoctonia solani]QRW25707.1 Electron transfer flavoprotein-ubiquinone oxidoreductase, 4Fe-4S [Rhizoctonia solani]